MKKYFYCLCAALLTVSALSGCKDDGTPDPAPGKPAVTLTEGASASTSVSFSIQVSEGADKAAYVCIRGGETVPSAAEILSDGTPVIDFAAPVTVGGLEPETTYVIAAAAGAGDAVSDVASLEMTTSAPDWDEEFVSLYTEGAYYGADITGGPNGQFVLSLSDVKVGPNGLPQNAGCLLVFSFHSDLAADADNARPAPGTYEYDLMDSFGKFTFDNNFSAWQRATGPGTYDPAGKLNGGTLTIAETAEGYEITALAETSEGIVIKASYTGEIKWENLSSPASYDLAPASAKAIYLGTTADNPDSDFWNITFLGTHDDGQYILQLELYGSVAADPQNPTLADGNYNPGTGTAAGTWIPGFIEGQYIYGTVLQIAEKAGVREYYFDTGSVSVTRSGDAYSITCDLTGEDDKPVKITYNGTFDIDNRHEGDDRLELHYSYNGGYNGLYDAAHNYYVELSDKELNASGMDITPVGYPATMIALDLYAAEAPSGTPLTIPAGTYTVSSTANPGECCDQYSGLTLWPDADTYDMKWLLSGTVDIAYGNGTYTIDIDVVDNDNAPFKAVYTGAIVMEDYSVAPQPARKMLYSELAGTHAKPQAQPLGRPGLAPMQSAPRAFGGLPLR